MSTTGIVEPLTIPQLGLQHTLSGKPDFSTTPPNDGQSCRVPDMAQYLARLRAQENDWRVPPGDILRHLREQRMLTLHRNHRTTKEQPYRTPRGMAYQFLTHHISADAVFWKEPALTEPSVTSSATDDAAAVRQQNYRALTAHELPKIVYEPNPSLHLASGPFLPITLLHGGFPDIPDGTGRPSDWAFIEEAWKATLREQGIHPVRYRAAQYRGQKAGHPLTSRPHRIPALPIPEELPLEDRVIEFDFVTVAAARSSLPKHYELTAQARAHRYHTR